MASAYTSALASRADIPPALLYSSWIISSRQDTWRVLNHQLRFLRGELWASRHSRALRRSPRYAALQEKFIKAKHSQVESPTKVRNAIRGRRSPGHPASVNLVNLRDVNYKIPLSSLENPSKALLTAIYDGSSKCTPELVVLLICRSTSSTFSPTRVN